MLLACGTKPEANVQTTKKKITEDEMNVFILMKLLFMILPICFCNTSV